VEEKGVEEELNRQARQARQEKQDQQLKRRDAERNKNKN
jgi:hypothetical protein